MIFFFVEMPNAMKQDHSRRITSFVTENFARNNPFNFE